MIRLIEYLAAGVVDSSGNPLASGFVRSFDSTTGSQQPIFQDHLLTQPYPNPAPLGVNGSLVAYTDRCLKLQISDSSRNYLYSIDGVGSTTAAIQPGDFAANAVGSAQIASLGISDANIATNAVSSSILANNCVTIASLALNSVTRPCQAASNAAFSSANSGSFQTTSTSAFVNVTNASVTITCLGTRPVFIICTDGYLQGLTSQYGFLQVWKNSATNVGIHQAGKMNVIPSQAFRWIDTSPSAGSNTYQLRAMVQTSSPALTITDFLIYAQEL